MKSKKWIVSREGDMTAVHLLKKHDSLMSAYCEVTKLARLSHGVKFFVLRYEGFAIIPTAPTKIYTSLSSFEEEE